MYHEEPGDAVQEEEIAAERAEAIAEAQQGVMESLLWTAIRVAKGLSKLNDLLWLLYTGGYP